MNALDQLNTYLRRVEGRLRLQAISRGAALTTIAALAVTVALVWIINRYAFSDTSVLSARFLLFVTVAAVIAFGLVIPLLRMNRWHAAKTAESKFPDFEQRLLTIAEKSRQESQTADPFVQLLAADTMDVARASEPDKLAPKARILGLITSAGVAVSVLLWLIFAGPGFLGYGTSLLWAGAPKSGARMLYDIIVSPGNKTVRRKSDQLITAKLLGFSTHSVRLYAQYQGTSKWEQVNMAPQPEDSGFEFLFGGLAENVDYYVEAGAVQTKHYTLKVVDLPGVKKIRVTYHYPKWSGMKDAVEDPGGDLRAVEGTEAEVAIQTDKPLSKGMLMLSDDKQIPLKSDEGTWLTARVPIQKDGMYHVAAIDSGENVRLSEDFFIEARKDSPPVVKITRPGRDAKVNPIEEVAVTVEGEDDFGLQELDLKYSVNGGPEKSVSMLKQAGAKNGTGTHVIYLEDYKLSPGDLVSIYATARDAQHSVKTDMYFIEAQPFERNYSQSQQAGGGGGGGQQADNEISQRQKDIIAATFNEQKNGPKNPRESAEDARFLSDLERKLAQQAKSLAERMKARQLAGASQEFQSFAKDMEEGAQAMMEGADKVQQQKWHDALVPQQKALQHVLRAEATFRDIQVAFGQRGGGGGAGGAGRDLENLFDLELDTEKNQYETGQQQQSASEQRQQEIDKALEKLKELARRQQELAKQAQNRQSFQQRWEQEMLRREAEELKRQMEQLQRGESSQQQSQQGQQGQHGQQSSSSQPSSSSQQSGQQSSSSQSSGQSKAQQQQQQPSLARRQPPITDPRMKEALDRLAQATEEMRQPASGQQNGNPDQNGAGQRRAAQRLQEAQDLLNSMQRQQSGQTLDDMAKQAEQLAAHQQDFQNRLRQQYSNPSLNGMNQQPGQTSQQSDKLASEKEKMADDLKRLEKQMQGAAGQARDSQPGVSSKLRDALAEIQQNELALRMKKAAEWLRQGQGMATWVREATVTQGLERLREQLKEAQALADGKGQNPNSKDPNKTAAERALARVEDARSRLERMAQGRGQQQGQQAAQPGQAGQQGQPSDQQGEQQGGQQQGGQQQGGQPGGQQGGQRQAGPYGPRGGAGAVGPFYGGGTDSGYREALRDLSQARQELSNKDSDPQIGRDADQLLRDLQRLNLGQVSDAIMAERIQRQLLPELERLELELRRKVDDQKAGQVRSAGSEQVPTGYAESVAEYFRRLSKGK